MIVVEESAEAYVVRSADLEIAFRHVRDRWQHSVSIRHHGESLPLMKSSEGSLTEVALPSPALQDLRLERHSADVVEFQLLGQAGKGIYSAAVRFDGAAQAIDFDICSRRRAVNFPLCTVSSYVLADRIGTPPRSHGDTLAVEVPHAKSALELSPVAIPGQPPARCRLLAPGAAARIVIGCDETTDANLPKATSVRWRYRMGASHLRG